MTTTPETSPVPPIENMGTARNIHARGMFAPLVRLAAHTGYAIGITARAEADIVDTESLGQIQEELVLAYNHMDDGTTLETAEPFITSETLERFQTLAIQINTLRERIADNYQTKENLLQDLATISHNSAYVACLIERDTCGNTNADHGSEL